MPSAYRFGSSVASATNLTGLNYVAGGYTFAFWAKGPNSNSGGDVFRHASTANVLRDGYAITFGSAELQARHYTAAGGTNYIAVDRNPQQDRIWKHFAITYDGSVVRGYLNGAARNRTAAVNVPTANAACTTTTTPSIVGGFVGNVFDLQIILGTFVPAQDIRLLMDPTYRHPNLKARYFGREFVGILGAGTLRDESNNGNNLATLSSDRFDIDAEPPIRPTFA